MTAPTAVALLRGINVGGRNRLPMSDLRAAATRLGWSAVETYLQSGNLLFAPPGSTATPGDLADDLERALDDLIGWFAPVVVVTAYALGQAVAGLPWERAEVEAEPKTVHVVFRRTALGEKERAELARICDAARPGDEVVAPEAEPWSYLRTPGGIGNSDLAARLDRSSRLPKGTARNWRTVLALAAGLGEQTA